MSGFTVREPTWEECNDLDQERVVLVHMTSSQPWDPPSETFSQLEGTLQEKTDHGYDLRLKDSRDINQLQVRGQDPAASLQTSPSHCLGKLTTPVGIDSYTADEATGDSTVGSAEPKLNDSEFRTRASSLKGDYFGDDGCFYVCPGVGVPDDNVFSCQHTVSLKSMQREQCP